MITTACKVLRTCGQNLDSLGKMIEVSSHTDKLQPSLRAVRLAGITPLIYGSFVAPTAAVIGKVRIGSNSSIWYAAVIRGDVNSITIGDGVTIGDRAMVHCTSEYSTSIGNRAIVGSGAICHGCVLEDESVVGTGAQIMDGAVVQKHAMVAAGALVSRGKIVPTGQLWSGIPAVFERELTAEEISNIVLVAEENTELAVQHQLESDKTWQMIEQEEFEHEQVLDRNPDYYKRLTEEQWSYKMGELENHDIPGRVLDSKVSSRTSRDYRT